MKKNNLLSKLALLCAVASIILSSCTKDKSISTTPVLLVDGPDLNFWALTSNNTLLTLNAKSVNTVNATTTVTGLQTGETLVAVDVRPATGQLYALSSASRIYVIDTKTGIAHAIGATPFTPAITVAANGTGFDFNPTVDRIRYVGFNGQNLRLHPETGAVAATDGAINGVANAGISAVAYTSNKAGASTTALFGIDINNDKLYKQDPPNDGKLVEIGSLTIDAEAIAGFDISPDGTLALAVIKVSGKQGLYNINLTNGKATRIKNDFPSSIVAMAIPTEPVAYAVTNNNELSIFNPLNPVPVVKPITGMQAGENILGMDMRPVNGQLYILGTSSRLYTVNASSGVAASVGLAPLTTLLSGTSFGFDFNPTVDRIRVVSNTGQNLRINPNDGLVAAIDGSLSPGAPSVNGAAYTNNFVGATTTALYDIDTQTSHLYKQDPPNSGTLVDIGALGVTASASNGFDIGGTSGTAYALLTVGGVTKVYTINLATGAATAAATISGEMKAFAVGLGF